MNLVFTSFSFLIRSRPFLVEFDTIFCVFWCIWTKNLIENSLFICFKFKVARNFVWLNFRKKKKCLIDCFSGKQMIHSVSWKFCGISSIFSRYLSNSSRKFNLRNFVKFVFNVFACVYNIARVDFLTSLSAWLECAIWGLFFVV